MSSRRVVVDARTQELQCEACGVKHKLDMPAAADKMAKEMLAFAEKHGGCK